MAIKLFRSDDDFKNMLWKNAGCPFICAFTVCCKLKGTRKGLIKVNQTEHKITGDGDIDLYMGKIVERLEKADFLCGTEIGMLDLSLWGLTY